MPRRDGDLNWVLIILVIIIVLPLLGAYTAAERTKNWLCSDWTPQRKRFWFSSLIGLLVLGAIAILIIVKATSN